MPKLDLTQVPVRTGTIYPPPYDALVAGRSSLRLGEAGGLTQFGVNLVTLAPGATSSMRHWHEAEDEFVWVTAGELVMVTNAGEEVMRPGDCAAFPANSGEAHHFINRTDSPASFLVAGTKSRAEVAHYPDQGLKVIMAGGKPVFLTEAGEPLPKGPA
jgi:uncharacterized cupin superfamily protein